MNMPKSKIERLALLAVLAIAVITCAGVDGRASGQRDQFYFTDFSTNPATDGWTGFQADQWEWGVATSSSCGSGGSDPAQDHSPSADNYLVGYNIGGCYPDSMPLRYFTSPSWNFAGRDEVTLTYWRWLGVEASTWDHAAVEISNDGGGFWQAIWTHDGASFADSFWTECVFDISEWAADEPNVKIRFVMGPSDGSVVYFGWNIDDFEILAPIPAELEGHVTDNRDAPVAGVRIRLSDSNSTAETDGTGYYHLVATVGTYDVTFSKSGYTTVTVPDVVLTQGSATVLDIELLYPELDTDLTQMEIHVPLGGAASDDFQLTNVGNGELTYRVRYLDRPPSQNANCRDPWDILFDWNLSQMTGDMLSAGCMPLAHGVWISAANPIPGSPNMLYLFDKNNGSLIDSVSTGQSLFPDLAYDGQWLYGCAATYFTQIDPADGEQTELFPTAQLGGDLPLGLTYLDDSDTFLTTSFSHDPIIEFSRTGEVIRTFWLGLPQITGLAYDTENGGSYLWVFAQDGPLQLSIYQADISFPGQEQLTGFVYHVPSLPSMTVMNSRGAALSGAWTPAAPVLACVIEGEPADRLLAFEMDVAPPWVTFSPEEGTLPPPPEENQVTVTVAVDGAQIAEPGIYEGQIRITSNDGDENPLDVPLTINVHGGNSIFGHVTGAGTGPLAGAEITVVEAALSTFSSEGGGYIITSIPTGEDYHVTCAAPGYRTATAYPVAVVPEEAVELDFDLELDLSPTPGPTFPPSPTAPPSTPTIPPTATASPTPPPTLPPTETATPTHEATNTATPSVTPEPPSPTATSPAATSTPIPSPTAGCDRFGVDLTLATGRVSPGEEFWCQADICSPAGPWNNAPFVALLDIGAADYWFFPHWRQYPPDFDYLLLDIPHGLMQLWVLEPFAWPDTGDSSFQPIWIHGALLTEDMSSIAGEMDTVTFGYGP